MITGVELAAEVSKRGMIQAWGITSKRLFTFLTILSSSRRLNLKSVTIASSCVGACPYPRQPGRGLQRSAALRPSLDAPTARATVGVREVPALKSPMLNGSQYSLLGSCASARLTNLPALICEAKPCPSYSAVQVCKDNFRPYVSQGPHPSNTVSDCVWWSRP